MLARTDIRGDSSEYYVRFTIKLEEPKWAESHSRCVLLQKAHSLIKGDEARAEEMLKLQKTLVQAQQWERAEAIWSEAEVVIRSIETNSIRAGALRNLGGTLFAQVQLQNQTETDWNRVEERYNIFKQRTYELLLCLVQHQWLLANTRAYAIEQLLLAKGFISFKPEIGLAFCDAFTWVDTFLNG